MIIEFEELGQVLEELREIKSLLLNNNNESKYPKYVTAEKAAEILGTTMQTLYNHSKNRLFPRYKFGDRTVYYKLEEIYMAFKKVDK